MDATDRRWGRRACTGGLLGAVLMIASLSPRVTVGAGPTASSVAAGWRHSCVRASDGTAWCWGSNADAQLGDGTRTDRFVPVPVMVVPWAPLGGVSGTTAGSQHSCAMAASGDDSRAWCWGHADDGQLGDGTYLTRRRAVAVTTVDRVPLTAVRHVDAGARHTCAADSGGAAWCWGSNSSGQLGDGSMTDRRPTAARVLRAGGERLGEVLDVSAGGFFACARTGTGPGNVWCWGMNGSGQLGDGTRTERHRAVLVTRAPWAALDQVVRLGAGSSHACAATSDGEAWCWGSNGWGELGDGTTTERHRAVRVTRAGGALLTGVEAVSAGDRFSCAVIDDGTARCWGTNDHGQLGDGSTTDRHRAVRVRRANGELLTGVVCVSAGRDHACAVTGAGSAWCWGDGQYGQLGNGAGIERHRAVRVTPTWAADS